jgi:hypothetical protein
MPSGHSVKVTTPQILDLPCHDLPAFHKFRRAGCRINRRSGWRIGGRCRLREGRNDCSRECDHDGQCCSGPHDCVLTPTSVHHSDMQPSIESFEFGNKTAGQELFTSCRAGRMSLTSRDVHHHMPPCRVDLTPRREQRGYAANERESLPNREAHDGLLFWRKRLPQR